MTLAVALPDANVLYPAPLRDLLLQLVFMDLYQVRWSAEIDDECALPDALVTGYAALIPNLSLPDQNDRHVLAAAITATAEVIVTFNLKDFPEAALVPYGMVAQHPDAFLQTFIATMPSGVVAAVRECLTRLTHPPVPATDYLKVLRRLGMTETAAFLDGHLAHWQP
jgi:hypothetical protein